MIELTITDDVAEVTLNAPEKRNAVDASALTELADAYTAAERAGVRALVLRGEGKGFCAGRDISQVDPVTDDALGFMRGQLQPLLFADGVVQEPRPSLPRTARASASGSGCWSRPTSSTSPSRRSSAARSRRSARRSTPAGTRCSSSASAPTARSTSSTPAAS